MSRQRNLNSLSHHLADDRRGLGRDDPVWPHYVKEAEKWDADLVDGWNKSMDVTLLFVSHQSFHAALFSAIVTAFLIESYQNLKPDNAEITAMGVIAILEYVRGNSTNQASNATSIEIPFTTEFQPTRIALLVNITWFLSLTLSMAVSLLAMLVKQWGEAYRSGSGLAPPCVQARIRQARYNKLKSWRTEDLVVSLPVLMHVALALFLLGLILFLLDLNRVVLIPVAIVVATTLLIYLGITLLPLFVAFCPYNTPLSSRWLWESFCQLCTLLVPRKWGKYLKPSCRIEEKFLCENTIPDYITTQALEWLIQHSHREVVDVAIKAISGADLDGWALLAQGSLVSVIAQKFTAICSEPLSRGLGLGAELNQNQHDAYLYGRALANISSHAELKPCSHDGVTGYSTSKNVDTQVEIDEEQVQAVEGGLLRLALSEDFIVSAYGIISLSSWYTSTSRSNQTREKWKIMLNKLIQLISPVSDASDSSNPQGLLQYPDGDILVDLVRALGVEVSHWRWEMSKQEMIQLLKSLVSLYRTPLLNGPARAGMSAALAVFALLFNDYQEIPALDVNSTYEVEVFLQDAKVLHQKATEKYESQHGDIHGEMSKPQRAKRRPYRAQSTAILCATNRDYLERYSNELLLFGLTGLLDSFAEVQLEEAGVSYSIAELVATQLIQIPITSQSQITTLPWVLPSTFDLKLYIVDVITRIVSPSPLGGQQDRLSEGDKASLLQYLSEKNIWADFGHQIIMPIIKLLNSADPKLQTQCLVALSEYCLGSSTFDDESESYPNPVDWMFIFSFDIPYQLIKIIEDNGDDELASRAFSALHSIVRIIPNRDEGEIELRSLLRRLILDGSIEAFSKNIACRAGYPNFGFLREQIIGLPRTLKLTPGNQDDIRIFKRLREFCDSHGGESGILALLLASLKSEIDSVGQHEPNTLSP